jgi:hypothetical protein
VRDEHDLAPNCVVRGRLQVGERVKAHNSARDPLRRCRAAVAERRDHQFLRKGREDFGRFGSASPNRHVERLDPDVRETERPELRDRPIAGPGLGLGPGQALTNLGRQPFGDVPGVIVIECRIP